MTKLQDLINDRKKLIKKYDNVLRLAIDDFDFSIDEYKKIKDRRDTLIGELITLEMFHQNKKWNIFKDNYFIKYC